MMRLPTDGYKQRERPKRIALKGYPLAWLGMAIFFYFGFDLILHRYPPGRTIIEVLLTLAGLFLPWLRLLQRKS